MGSRIGSDNEIINHLTSNKKRWFAVYTKFKCEKYVVDQLGKKGIHAYIPLLTSTKQYTRKVKTYQLPLINCYVFVCITKEEYVRVLETEYVMRFIRQRKNLISIPENEISVLKHIVGEFQEGLSLHNCTLQIGEPIEVISGSLTGLKGYVLDVKNKKEIVIQLDHIGIQLKININSAYIRPVKQLRRQALTTA